MRKSSYFYDIKIESESSFSVCLLKKNALIVFIRITITLMIACFILDSFSNDFLVLCIFLGASTVWVQGKNLYHLWSVIRIPTLIYRNGELSSDGVLVLGRDEKLKAKVKTVNTVPSMGCFFVEFQVSMQVPDGSYRHLFSSSDENVINEISKIVDSR